MTIQASTNALYPWHADLWQALVAVYRAQRLPHAILLTGPTGLGQFEFAQLFAQHILCEHGMQQSMPCGQCRFCRLVQANSHPDLMVVQPEAGSATIRIDAVRAMVAKIQQTAQQQHYKVLIINPAEALNMAASNALLKNLEEPTPATLFLLVCTELQRIPATIRSRCQRVLFKIPARASTRTWLQTQLKDVQVNELLLTLAAEVPLTALRLASADQQQQRQKFFKHLQQLSTGAAAPGQIASQWLKADFKELVQLLCQVVADTIKLNLSLPDTTLLNQDQLNFIQKLASKLSALQLFKYLDELYALRATLNKAVSLNQHLIAESIFGSWYVHTKF